MIKQGPLVQNCKIYFTLKEPDQQEHHYVAGLCQQLLELQLGVNC